MQLMLSQHLSTTHTQLRLTLMVRREESMSFGMIRSLASQSLSHNKKSICLLRYHTSPLLFLLSTHDLTQILSKHYGKILKLNSLLILDRGLHLVILMMQSLAQKNWMVMLLVGNVRMILTMSSTLVASLIQGFQVLSSPGRVVGNVTLLWKGWIASLLTLYGYLSFSCAG